MKTLIIIPVELLIDNYPGFGYIDTYLIENKQIEKVRM